MWYNTAMQGMLQIRLFGGLHVVCEQGDRVETIRFRSQKGKLLLAYLATFPGWHSRDKLSKIICPNISSAKSLLRLRVELHSLRYLLKNIACSDILSIKREYIELNVDEIWIDIRMFEQFIEHAAHVDEISRISFLEQACQLYTGDYMEGFEASWIHPKREIYRDMLLKACEELCLLYTKYGEHQKAYLLLQQVSNYLSDTQIKILINIISDKNQREKYDIKLKESIQSGTYRVPTGMLTLAALYKRHGLISQSIVSRCIAKGGALFRRSDNLLISIFGNPYRATEWLVSEIETDQNLSGALTIQIWDDENKNKNINIIQQLLMNLNSGYLICTDPIAYWLQRDRKWFLQEVPAYLYMGSHERLFVINPKSYNDPPFQTIKFPLIKRHLPHMVGDLLGRECELQAMRDWLTASTNRRASRLLTITGIGGVGKTHLALAFAHEVAYLSTDDVIFLSLENTHSIEEFKFAILQALHEDISFLHFDLIEILFSRKAIIILDHIDHIRSEIKDILLNYLSKNNNIKIITTSRIPLNLPEEHVISISPLPVPSEDEIDPSTLQAYACVNLFLNEARKVRYDFHLSPNNAPQIAALCRYTGGIPGVIKEVAKRLNIYPLSKLLDMLSQQLIDSIDSIIAWNFYRLPESQQRILCCLSIFKSHWTLEEASEIIQEPLLHEYIERLIISGLVVAKCEDNTYLFMVPTAIREFAARHLDESDKNSLKKRYILYFKYIVNQIMSKNQILTYDCLLYIKQYRDHLLASIEFAIDLEDIEFISNLIPYLVPFFEANGIISIVLQWYEKIINMPQMSDSDKLNLMNAFAYLYFRTGNLLVAKQIYSCTFELATKCGLFTKAAEALIGLAGIALDRIQIAEAEDILNKVLNEYAEFLTPCLRAHALFRLGHVYAAQMKIEIACQTIEQACQIYRQIDEKRFLALALNALGALKIKIGEIKQAESIINESLNLLNVIQDKSFLPYALLRWGDLHIEYKKYKEAESIYYKSLDISKNLHIVPAQRAALIRLGELYYFQRRYRLARQVFKEACKLDDKIYNTYTHPPIEKIWYLFLINSLDEAKHLLIQYIEYLLEKRVFNDLDKILIILLLIYRKQRNYRIYHKLLKFLSKMRKVKGYKNKLYRLKMQSKEIQDDELIIDEMDKKILDKINDITQSIDFE
jgi:tetratricopeptide (TPR) repeat protein